MRRILGLFLWEKRRERGLKPALNPVKQGGKRLKTPLKPGKTGRKRGLKPRLNPVKQGEWRDIPALVCPPTHPGRYTHPGMPSLPTVCR